MTAARLEHVRTGAAVAALVLAVLSRGDALVLAALLALAAWRPPALVVIPALVASSWRWGSTSLEALAGAQAVLGPAGLVGPPAAAAASWLAGIALLLSAPVEVGGTWEPGRVPAAPNVRPGRVSRLVEGMAGPIRASHAPNVLVGTIAVGAAVAAVVAGPAPGGALWVRGAAIVIASVVARSIARWRAGRAAVARWIDVLGAVAALGALAAVTLHAPAWSGTIDDHALARGVVLAIATGVLVAVGRLSRAAMGQRGT